MSFILDALMSSTRLLVLGVVRIFQPVHGYDVRRELLSWRVDQWANVAPGSIPHPETSICFAAPPGCGPQKTS